MKNRAKCKLCQSIIESFHESDYVICKCGHISVSGGLRMQCSALDWDNFFRVDDQGNEVIVKVVQSLPDTSGEQSTHDVKPLYKERLTKQELLKMLEQMIENVEKLPSGALNTPVTHYDLHSALLLISAILHS